MQVMKFDLSDEQAAALTEELATLSKTIVGRSRRVSGCSKHPRQTQTRAGAPAFVTGKGSRARVSAARKVQTPRSARRERALDMVGLWHGPVVAVVDDTRW